MIPRRDCQILRKRNCIRRIRVEWGHGNCSLGVGIVVERPWVRSSLRSFAASRALTSEKPHSTPRRWKTASMRHCHSFASESQQRGLVTVANCGLRLKYGSSCKIREVWQPCPVHVTVSLYIAVNFAIKRTINWPRLDSFLRPHTFNMHG